MNGQNVTIIGGGIIGLATACRLLEKFPGSQVAVLEKEESVGRHQTGNNSGVLHAGLYYKPGSVKARMAVTGIRQMVAFCQENRIPHEICGKLVVACDDEEVARAKNLLERGTQNGLEGLQWLNRDQMREIEPHVEGIAAVRVPQEGIVDYARVCEVMVDKIHQAGGEVRTRARVQRLTRKGGEWVASTPVGDFVSDYIVNCAGLHCDRVSQLAGEKRDVRILPFRGEYYKIRPQSQHLVRNLIYPVPDPKFPFLGVHYTRLIHGGIEAGPNAVLALAREGYKWTDVNLPDMFDALSYCGFWKFMSRYPSMCWQEVKRSFSKKLFCRSLQKLIPEIRVEDLSPGGAGVRAQAITPKGELVQDFCFVGSNKALHVLNAPSPGATASLAIGLEIIEALVKLA